jgi:hypothetical protein
MWWWEGDLGLELKPDVYRTCFNLFVLFRAVDDYEWSNVLEILRC